MYACFVNKLTGWLGEPAARFYIGQNRSRAGWGIPVQRTLCADLGVVTAGAGGWLRGVDLRARYVGGFARCLRCCWPERMQLSIDALSGLERSCVDIGWDCAGTMLAAG